jgi:glutathione S-transferase
MPNLELIELYPSPFSERVRWVLELKGLAYRRTAYMPVAGEEEHQRKTGIATAPVLLADGEVIGDSDHSVEWLEARPPAPALVPADPRRRAQVRAWELLATEVLAPAARLVMIGRFREMNIQPLADHFTVKYRWSDAEEARVDRLLRTALPDLAAAVAKIPYLVGDEFTRADLTVAAMLTPNIGLPPDDLFSMDAGMRPMFGTPFGADPALTPLREWRDRIYRQHRGRRVEPAAA